MKAEDIINIWRYAGFNTIPNGVALKKLERFAAMVALNEREECAKLCDEIREKADSLNDAIAEEEGEGHLFLTGKAVVADRISVAIRARGKV